ncbi:hypothetical protein Tco_1255251 [Tanacetum coccineum]
MVKPVWNNAQRVNHQNFAKKTHPCAKKNMVPRAVLIKSGLVSINTARQVNVAHTKTIVNAARPMSYLSKKAHSTVKRPIHKNTAFKNSNFNQRVNTVKDKNVNTVRPKAIVNAVKGNNVVKASACWGNPQMDLQDQGVIDSGYQGTDMVGTSVVYYDYERDRYRICLLWREPKGSKFNFVGGKTSIELPFDPNMSALEYYSIFDLSRDDEDDGAEVDMKNLDTIIQVSPIPTTRIHKDHPLNK